MPNNVAVSITADVADLQVKRAIMSAELKAATADLNSFAKTANTSGITAELRTGMLGAADTATKARSSIRLVDAELKSLSGGSSEAAAAMGAVQHGSAGVTRELLVMGRELSRGNFNRMAGSATILAGRLGILTPQFLLVAAGVVAVVAPFALLAAAMESAASDQSKYQGALEATANYAGLTADSYRSMANELASSSRVGVGEARKELLELINAGKFSGPALLLVGEDANAMSKMTGESADKFIEQFDKMGDDVAKFAKEYNDHYHQLTTAQLQHIQALQDSGDVEGAQMALLQDLYGYLGAQAPQQVGLLTNAWRTLGGWIESDWETLKKFTRDATAGEKAAGTQATLSGLYARKLALQRSGQESGLEDTGAMASLDAQIGGLEKQLAVQQRVVDTQKKSAQTAHDTAQAQTEGVDAAAKLHEQFEASKTSGEKLKKTLADINIELAKATKADPGNRALYEQEAAAARAQAVKSDTPHAPKPKGNDEVQQWTEQLHAEQVASGEFFQDQTAKELAFWQSKVALTQQGSKQWLEVQTKIYDSQKTLAHQAYADQLAALNDQIEADRNNWAKEQADWNAKLAFIKAHYGQEHTEYQQAYREFEAAEREHQQQMAAAQKAGEATAQEVLKKSLETARSIREADAREAETLMKAQAGGSPLGEIQAAQQVAVLHQQLNAQNLADLTATYAAEDALRQQAIARALADYTKDSTQYQTAVDAKKKADAEYYATKASLDEQSKNQAIQDILAVQQAYHGYVDSLVSASVRGAAGAIAGTETWRQAEVQVYNAVASEFLTMVDKMVSNWIVQHVFMTAAERAQLAVQTAAHAAGEAAKTGATMVGTEARVVASGSAAVQTAAIESTLNMKQVTAAAATGAAKAYQAMAGIPIIGPFLGAGAAAATFAAIEGYGAMASLDVGTNYLPSDMVIKAHEGERIIPKADNSALMSALANRGEGGGGGLGSISFGDFHVHGAPTGMSSDDFRQALSDHAEHVAGSVAGALRGGWRPSSTYRATGAL